MKIGWANKEKEKEERFSEHLNKKTVCCEKPCCKKACF